MPKLTDEQIAIESARLHFEYNGEEHAVGESTEGTVVDQPVAGSKTA